MTDRTPHYYAMLDDGEVYAIVRRTGGLLERWSPDRGVWKEALFHWDTFFGMGDVGEKRGISEEDALALVASGEGLRDISDGDWDWLNQAPR